MKYILISIIVFLLHFTAQTIKTQKYYVYDGDQFSVMFICNEGGSEITKESLLEIQYTAKNSNGEIEWYHFEMYDFEDYSDLDQNPGFTCYCVDINNNTYILDYSSDGDELDVSPVQKDGKRGTTFWHLTRRVE